MSARAAAEAAARAVLEAPMYDPGAVADAAVAGRAPVAVGAAPATTAQRGRTGKVSWNPALHKRGYHGRFAPGSQQAQTANAQAQLQRHGLYQGAIDGQRGPQTQQAIKAFQQRYGLPQTGQLDAGTVATMHAPPPQTAQQVAAADAKAAAAAAPKGKAAAKGSRSGGTAAAGTSRGSRSGGTRSGKGVQTGKGGVQTRKTRGTGRISGGTAGPAGAASWQGMLPAGGVMRVGDGTQTKQGKPAARGAQEVQNLQAKLEQLGFDLGAAGTDGKFGAGTESAVKAFQRAYGLKPDGVVGAKTILMLNLLSQSEGMPNPNAMSIDQMALTRAPRRGGKAGAGRQLRQMGVVQQAAVVAERAASARLRS